MNVENVGEIQYRSIPVLNNRFLWYQYIISSLWKVFSDNIHVPVYMIDFLDQISSLPYSVHFMNTRLSELFDTPVLHKC